MLIIPLRTDSPIRRTPMANYGLIAATVMAFLLSYDFGPARRPGAVNVVPIRESPVRPALQPYRLVLTGSDPELHQLFTYQFLHDGWLHLLGNLLFLWVFGNAVNAKMGDLAYILFYLSCGVAAGAAYLSLNDTSVLGASGAIAGVTTAFLVLFPRSRTTFFYWVFFVGYFEISSMILIVAKVIVYDNLIAPLFSGPDGVAYSAHLAGYLAGAVIAVGLMLIRAVPRDQFDLIALWKRAYQRRAFAQATRSDPMADTRARYGHMVRTDPPTETKPDANGDESAPTRNDAHLDQVTELRRQITAAHRDNNLPAAAAGYLKLIELDANLLLPRRQQLDIANALVSGQEYARAADAYEKCLAHYPTADRPEQVRLMLGIVCAKYLEQYERAEGHLLACREALLDTHQREQCDEWLAEAARALGRPTPEPE